MKKDIQYQEKFLNFAVRIVKLKNFLNQEKLERTIADQILRSGTSIGANQREANYAESDEDFIHKLSIAQKECNETLYWLELLQKTQYISEEEFKSLFNDASELLRILTSSIRTTKLRLHKNK